MIMDRKSNCYLSIPTQCHLKTPRQINAIQKNKALINVEATAIPKPTQCHVVT